MDRLTISIIILTLGLGLNGCGPKGAGQESRGVCVPYQIRADVNNNSMTVIWKSDCDKLTSGYNIYVSEIPLWNKYKNKQLPESVKPHNFVYFPGDTNRADGIEHYQADGLENGKQYFVSVRTVYPDRSLSKSSREITAFCYPKGVIELPLRNKAKIDGFSFGLNKSVSTTDLNNDIYFFSKDGKNYLNSPNKMDGFLRRNKLLKLPFKGEFKEIIGDVENSAYVPQKEKVEVNKGDWIQIMTEDFKFVLVKVLDISGEGGKKKIKLFYAANTVPNSLIF